MKKLFLIDAYALIFRSYYAFISRPMRNADGLNTSAVFGFTKFLSEIIRRAVTDGAGIPGKENIVFVLNFASRLDACNLRQAEANTMFLNLEPKFDASANDPSGPLVDVANYFHAHCYDLAGMITLPEDIDEDGFKVKNVWSDWNSVVRGNDDADTNFGPAKVSIKGEDDYRYWNAMTGFDFEEIEEFKYIGMNLDGQIVITACEKNIATKDNAEIWFALVFDKVVAEEAAE